MSTHRATHTAREQAFGSNSQNTDAHSTNSVKRNHISHTNIAILVCLLLVFTSNQWCRQVLYYLCNFNTSAQSDSYHYVNVELMFNQEFYGSLASFIFTGVFAFVSLFAGVVADNYDRRVVISVSCASWSLVTITQAYVKSSWQLIPLRILLGVSQAFFNPAAFTILSDLFPSDVLASANSVLSSGIYLGGALASLSLLLNAELGWRNTMSVVGMLGVLFSVINYFLLIEPRVNKSSHVDSQNSSTMKASFNAVLDMCTSFREVISIHEVRVLLLGSLLRFAAGFSIAIWKAPFVYGKFPGNEEFFSKVNALIISFGGIFSSIIGGIIADRLSAQNKKSPPRSRVWVAAIGSLLAVPLWTMFIAAKDVQTAAVCLLFKYLVAECWMGPTIAALYGIVPFNRRGTTQGMLSILTAVANIAPYIIGVMSGAHTGQSIGTYILWIVNSSYFFAGLIFVNSAIRDDIVLVEKWTLQQNLLKDFK